MEVDSSWLVITKTYAIIMTILTLIVTAGLLYLGLKLSRLLDLVLNTVEPLLAKVEKTAVTVSETADSISQRTDRVASDAEQKLAQATSTLERAAEAVHRAALGPAGAVGAAVIGVLRGLRASDDRKS